MKITSVKTAASDGHCMHLWVKIETDAGITGLGECVHGGHQAIAIIHDLREKLIGRDPVRHRRDFRGTAPRSRLRGRLRGRADHRADRHRDRALRPEGQGARRAGLRTSRRQVPRQDPRLCRLRSDARHELRRGQEGRRRRPGARLHGAEDRPRHRRLRLHGRARSRISSRTASTTLPANGSTTAWSGSPRW